MAGSAGTARQAGATSWSCRRRAPSERARSRRRSHCPLTSVTSIRPVLLASVSGSFTSAVANHGVYAVFGLLALGALLPVGRGLVALGGGAVAAGVLAVHNGGALIGAAVWSFAFVGIGYALGKSYNHFEHDFRYVEYAIVAGIVVGLAYLVYRRRPAARVTPRADDSSR